MSSLAQAASGPEAAGQMRPLPIVLAPIAAGSVPGHRPDRPVQCQFADGGVIRDGIGRDRLHSAHHRQHDRQIEVAAFLRQVGGREIDGDVLVGKPQADRVEGVAYPLAAFGDRLVRQAHDGERGGPRRHADLDLDRPRLDADERER